MTALTKTGQPRIGAKIEVQLLDDSWLPGKIVGKAYGQGALRHTVVAVLLEHEVDGDKFRSEWQPWGEERDGVIWRDVVPA